MTRKPTSKNIDNTHDVICCDMLAANVASPEVPLTYHARFREWGIRVLDGGSSKICINHCPWCGMRLPGALRDRWLEDRS